ncbi:MAG: cell division FtsA domain-containing protein [candidate division FCPU426 bacterium]
MTAPLFALDIGTRKVAGLVVEPRERGLRVLAARVQEHPDRAMLDGQVHKVEAVAAVVAEVKAALEADLGLKLRSAAVAAAGRALLTRPGQAKRRLPFPAEVQHAAVLEMELEAVRQAQAGLQPSGQLHCVGFSTVRQYVDGEALDDIAGHRGLEIGVEVLATFLPRQVVDSLLVVLRRAGLQATSLTLEPIAALEAVLPQDLRRLNLALVDIGAGTSDIALTRDGSVFGYAMVTQAGDEVTERLCEHYLLSFQEAERLKRRLDAPADTVLEAVSILNQPLRLTVAEVRKALVEDMARLAQAIAEPIRQLNGGSPRAVVMVGGGSSLAGLGEAVAGALELEPTRVGARGPETIAGVDNPTPWLHGIEGVTPLGIALTALRGRGLKFLDARVNQEAVQLLALHERPTVFDALLSAGREIKRLVPRPGQALTYTLDGRLQTVPGTIGEPARLSVDGKPATLDTPVAEGSRVEVTEAVDGQDAVLRPSQVPRPQGPFWCTVNGQNIELAVVLAANGQPAAGDDPLPDRSELAWVSDRSLAQLVPETAGLAADPAEENISIRMNGQTREVRRMHPSRLHANGRPCAPDYHPKPGDRIEWSQAVPESVRLRDLLGELPIRQQIKVMVNGEPKWLETGGARILLNGQPAGVDDPVPPEAEIVVESAGGQPPILSQALADLNLTPPPNAGPLKLKVNGQEAAFTTPLRDGAEIEITFG